ncbi:MAG: hypothetical protein A4E34_01214 [Methanoregula sp. PtaU1.Bin006]|nr:MAG: hypothetical protein A4E33_01219 [Methanoregula sp. PtaB.Bin085]OPY34688.1 MAG: hypothetical protein A4E34_01214 [Methanoregula sp. PtaU1.Bin006]
MWGMPTRRGRSISGAPKSVKSNLNPVIVEIDIIMGQLFFKTWPGISIEVSC